MAIRDNDYYGNTIRNFGFSQFNLIFHSLDSRFRPSLCSGHCGNDMQGNRKDKLKEYRARTN